MPFPTPAIRKSARRGLGYGEPALAKVGWNGLDSTRDNSAGDEDVTHLERGGSVMIGQQLR